MIKPIISAHCRTDIQTEIQSLIEQLNASSVPVIVEGKKDKRALESLGVSTWLTVNKPLFQIVESLTQKEVAILTDLDKEGKALYGKLQQECLRRGIKINNRLRHFLLRETPLATMEGLPHYLRSQCAIPSRGTLPF